MIVLTVLGFMIGYALIYALGRHLERRTFGADNMPKTRTPGQMLAGVIAERKRGRI